ncbi:MAG TPA: carboxypeptidase-like regulatory domain-containing protein [Planctomycetota bacterium]|nr:carboxypeptidase-like regulatory domain-containing protein [Planctomycetota bacterium]
MRSVVPVLLVLLAIAAIAFACWPNPIEPMPPREPGPRPGSSAPANTGAGLQNAAPTAEPASANDANAAQRIEVAVDGDFVVRGRTVTGVDAPVANVKVRARAYQGAAAIGEPTVDVVLTSDGGGQFAWSLPAPAALMFMELRGQGTDVRSYPETFVVAPGDPPPPPFDLWVVPLSARVVGIVLDERQHPIAGARVSTSRDGGVKTDAAGRFEVPVEAKPSVSLYARAPGFVELHQDVAVDVRAGTGEAELHLRTANRIHGRVTDSDMRAIAGATVRTFYTIYTDGAQTDADGRYVLDNLDPSLESHSVFARKDGYVEGKAEVKATGPDVEQDLVLGRGVEVRGVVTGPGGQPLAAATVFLGFSPNAYDRLDAISDIAGAFRFACVAEGEQTLNVERRGFSGTRLKVQVPKPPAPPVVVPVRLEVGHWIGGRAIDGDGKPVAGVAIAPRLDDEYLDGIRAKTDDDGHFRLDGVPARGLSLEFYGKGVLRKQQTVDAVDRGDLEVALERHGRMAGTVVDGRTGRPLTEFRIRFAQARLAAGEQSGGGYSATWVRGGKVFHDEAGVFRIDDEVRVGSVFGLEASADGYGAAVHDHVVAVLDPDPSQVVIALYPGAVIEGVVRERDTLVPIAGARLKAFSLGRPLQPHEPNDDEGRPMAISDANGGFRLENVGPGRVSIAVVHPDWLPLTHGPIEVTPQTRVPPQEIQLENGVHITVLVRDAGGAPLAGARVSLTVGRTDRTLDSDAEGKVVFDHIAGGDHQLAVMTGVGTPQAMVFQRPLQVGREDRRIDFVTKDGDATLAVVVSSPEPLPPGQPILVMGKGGTGNQDAIFRRQSFLQGERTLIPLLPAAELTLVVFQNGLVGSTTVTTVAGRTVEAHLEMKKPEAGTRR